MTSRPKRFFRRCPDHERPCLFVLSILLVFCAVVRVNSQDENANRKRVPSSGTKAGGSRSGSRNVRKPQPLIRKAAVVIQVDPADSTVSLDGQELDIANTTLGLQLTGLKVGPHVLRAHRVGYAEKQQVIELKPGENERVNIRLEPLIGKLGIVPNIPNVSIRIEAAGDYNSTLIGTYVNRVSDLPLRPGIYDISLSRSGYEAATRRITIRPGESLFLEPQLLALPEIKPPLTPSVVNTAEMVPTRTRLELDGKYLIVYLEGSSGDAARKVGTINVTIAPSQNTVSGVLSGRECRVQFVQLENVAESSVVEAPGPSNRWAKIVVRLRPKSSKRPIAFAINWSLLENTSR